MMICGAPKRLIMVAKSRHKRASRTRKYRSLRQDIGAKKLTAAPYVSSKMCLVTGLAGASNRLIEGR
jgi:hypothetical protein